MTNLPDPLDSPDGLRDHAHAVRERKIRGEVFTVGDEVMIGPDMAKIEVVTKYGPALTVKVRFTTGKRRGQLHGTMIQDLGEVDPITKLGSIFTKMFEDEKADEAAKEAEKAPATPETAQLANPAIAGSGGVMRRQKTAQAPSMFANRCECPCHKGEPFQHGLPCCTVVAAHDKGITVGIANIEFRVKLGRLERAPVAGLGTARPDETYCPVCDVDGHAEGSPACQLFGEYGQR